MTENIGCPQLEDHADRRRWMSLLAKADGSILEDAWSAMADRPRYTLLRPAEVGMVMVRGRAGGVGARFNFGEMTVVRCAVRTESGAMGLGYVAGRDKRHAELAAVFDALLQGEERRFEIDRILLRPVEKALKRQSKNRRAKTQATKVDFFTMVRGED